MEPMDIEKTEEEYAAQDKYRIVICGANAYDKKYYFNKKFDNLPTNIKEELHIICVLFTEETGGIFTISFTPFGHIEFDTRHEEGDLLYDEISAGLLVRELRNEKAELFESPAPWRGSVPTPILRFHRFYAAKAALQSVG